MQWKKKSGVMGKSKAKEGKEQSNGEEQSNG